MDLLMLFSILVDFLFQIFLSFVRLEKINSRIDDAYYKIMNDLLRQRRSLFSYSEAMEFRA